MNRAFLIMSVVALLAATSGYFVAKSLGKDERSATRAAPSPVVEDILGKRRPDFTHQDIHGDQVSASDFDGSLWLINFWATWCKPCIDEMPMLSQLNSAESGPGVQIVGIALDDAERARRFAEDLLIEYPILVGRADVVLTGRRYGNSTGLLPFSVLVDADGTVRWSHLGALDKEILLEQISALK